MFQFAATNFGDANAQYNLARMYLDGADIVPKGGQAARWLYLAADKGHLQAQALLGQMLFTGHDGVQAARTRPDVAFGCPRCRVAELKGQCGAIEGPVDRRSLRQGHGVRRQRH